MEFSIQQDGPDNASKSFSTKEFHRQVEKIKDAVNAFNKSREGDQFLDKNVIFVGCTGAGKSTLVNYLAGNELKAAKNKYQDDVYNIKASNAVEGIEIGNSTSSCTKIPAKLISENKVAYWDCPGFGDTEGQIQDITNAYFINELFNKSTQALASLVVDFNTIVAKRHNQFLDLANEVFKMGLIDSLQSVSLVVTSSKLSKERIIEYLSDEILPAISGDNSQNLEKLVQYYIKNRDQVTVFPMPREPGKIDTNNAKTIQEVVNSVAPLSDTIVKPSISEGTINAISKWGKVTNQIIKEIIQLKISESFREIYQNCKLQNEYSELKVSLKAIKDKCDAIHQSHNEDELIEAYQEFQRELQISNEKDDHLLSENIDLLKFFTIYNSEVSQDLSSFDSVNQTKML